MGASLHYGVQTPVTLIGSLVGTTRTPATLTALYADGSPKIFETGGYSELVLHLNYTVGASETNNSIEIKLEDSNDRTNFYQLTNESASAGTSTLTAREFTFAGAAATSYPISYRLDVSYKYMRISVKETGVAANFGTVYVDALLSG